MPNSTEDKTASTGQSSNDQEILSCVVGIRLGRRLARVLRLTATDEEWTSQYGPMALRMGQSLQEYLHKTILLVNADPTDTPRLRLQQEVRDICEVLRLAQMRDIFTVETCLSARPGDLVQTILDVHPAIVHFSGHGRTGGGLCFENASGVMHPITPDAMSSLFELVADEVHCVVLNACYSEAQAAAIARHIDWVIGMKTAIGDEAAIAFAVGFYRTVGAGRTYDAAFKFGLSELRLLGIPEHLTPVLLQKLA